MAASLIGQDLLGLELEMIPVNLSDGSLHVVDDAYFRALNALRGGADEEKVLEGHVVALSGPRGVTGIDNGFALLETAFAPLNACPGVMAELEALVARELSEISQVLKGRGAALVNLARHPDAPTDHAAWRRLKAPRSIYDYLVHDRGWTHAAGFDSQAQNGPTTSIGPGQVVAALNMLLRAGPAFIALFANSPFAQGRATGLLESRMTLWERVTATSRVSGDRAVVGLPDAPFRDLADYFTWTFGRGRAMLALPPGTGPYKGEGGLVRVVGDPCFLDFLAGGPWQAHAIGPGGADREKCQEVSPQLAHVDALQWSNFLDFRIRYALTGAEEGPGAFLDALRKPGEMEAFFSEKASSLYLENRVAGACFSESRSKLDPESPIRRSMPLAASALQWGLIKNLDRAAATLEGGCWTDLERDREAAIHVGLADPAVKKRVETVLRLAEEGLPEEDRWALSYAWDVWSTGRSNADRALETVASDGIVSLIPARLLVD
ncbi:glutamate-cysteine ligase family protein [Rhodospirillum sp. A1_3_36]|uniref:glutamate-cysteine ligase family protein n=1 Tax=Rhodospirillum sp. A1_3_36 TaxID=3391666 RepID=UPI0039A5C46D